MPVSPTYPGVYIEELPSGVRTITGVATSITAFVGSAPRGVLDEPTLVQSFAEYTRTFGGLSRSSSMSYAVNQFFLNGGRDALIVRVIAGGAAATVAADTLGLVAASPGEWGEQLRVRVDYDTRPQVGNEELFSMSIRDTATGVTERFQNISVLPDHPRFVSTVLEQTSALVRVTGTGDTRPEETPDAPADAPAGQDPLTVTPTSLPFIEGSDGGAIGEDQVSDAGLEATRQGIYALEKADIFNLLCIPPFSLTGTDNIGIQTRDAAAAYCLLRRAVFLVDPISLWTSAAAVDLDSFMTRSANAALYFPKLIQADPLQEGRLAEFAPCGAVAGVISRTDAQRGIWKAPAGIDATLKGVSRLSVKLTDGNNGVLNPLAVNCLRSFPVIGRVIWGGRTLVGADAIGSEWKYTPVRRTALYIEETLYRGTQWAVFEPNDEPLWSQIRLNIGAFLQTMFRQGAFQGKSPKEAYFVQCSSETTTQADIDNGIVNIVVGFAPLKPAEFVIVKLQQISGQQDA